MPPIFGSGCGGNDVDLTSADCLSDHDLCTAVFYFSENNFFVKCLVSKSWVIDRILFSVLTYVFEIIFV